MNQYRRTRSQRKSSLPLVTRATTPTTPAETADASSARVEYVLRRKTFESRVMMRAFRRRRYPTRLCISRRRSTTSHRLYCCLRRRNRQYHRRSLDSGIAGSQVTRSDRRYFRSGLISRIYECNKSVLITEAPLPATQFPTPRCPDMESHRV